MSKKWHDYKENMNDCITIMRTFTMPWHIERIGKYEQGYGKFE